MGEVSDKMSHIGNLAILGDATGMLSNAVSLKNALSLRHKHSIIFYSMIDSISIPLYDTFQWMYLDSKPC
jgi:hypothetical protein